MPYPTYVGGMRLTAALLTAAQPRLVRKDADTTIISDSTLNDDPDLFLSVEANAIYRLQFYLKVTGNTTGDFKMQLTGPSGSTGSFGAYGLDTTATATGGAGATPEFIRTTLNNPRSYGTTSTASPQVILGTGLVRIDATAGTLQLQWSQDTSTATNTILQQDSWMELHRIE